MMGANNGARVFVLLEKFQAYLAGAAAHFNILELFQTRRARELDADVQEQDRRAGQAQNARFTHEVASTYTLRRDLHYAARSRRWLYARGWQSKLNGNYEQWAAFVRMNNNQDLQAYIDTPPNQLAEKTFSELMT